ncbi:MAG: hypothetical protein NVS9B4_18090 [Candidatus Acidiferrum sp.]
MQAKNKIRALIFSLVLPYFAVVMYFVFRIQEHPLPTWFPYFGMTYLLGSIILVTVVSRKVARGTQPQTTVQSRPALRMALRAYAGYLIAAWCGLFLWGAVETIEGKLEWQRALPAGAFLLAFIGLFARGLYTDVKDQKQ